MLERERTLRRKRHRDEPREYRNPQLVTPYTEDNTLTVENPESLRYKLKHNQFLERVP